MTQLEHDMVAGIILIVLYQFCFHMFLKHHPVTQTNIQELEDIFKDSFF